MRISPSQTIVLAAVQQGPPQPQWVPGCTTRTALLAYPSKCTPRNAAGQVTRTSIDGELASPKSLDCWTPLEQAPKRLFEQQLPPPFPRCRPLIPLNDVVNPCVKGVLSAASRLPGSGRQRRALAVPSPRPLLKWFFDSHDIASLL
jgi:hypothetical protein